MQSVQPNRLRGQSQHTPVVQPRGRKTRVLLSLVQVPFGMQSRRSDRVSTCVGSMAQRDEGARVRRLLVVPVQRLLVGEEQDVEDGLADRAHAAEELETAGAVEVCESEVLQFRRVGDGEREGPDGDVWGLGAVEAEEGEGGSVAENAIDGVL